MLNTVMLQDFEEVYQRDIPWNLLEEKTILVTGAYGMLASYLTNMLIFLNEYKGMHIQIIALVRNKEKCRKKFGEYVDKKYFFVKTDCMEAPIDIEVPLDYIIHAASLASPQFYATCPIDVLLPNTVGHYNLLRLAVKKKVSGYLLFSSSDIYGRIHGVDRISEKDYGIMDTLDIHNCYSESKRMAETMCKAFYHQEGVSCKIARIWHTYAPTMDIEHDPRVFASFVNDIVHHRNIVMKSEGLAKRSFCYVADAIAAYFLILLKGESGEAYNVCNSEEWYSIAELAEILTGIRPELGLKVIKEARLVNENYVENIAANYVPPDSSKLEALGWNARYSVSLGFKRVLTVLMDD